MGPIKTHGPTVLAAIEQNDVNKVTEILTNKFRDKQKTKQFLVSEVRRPQSESVAVPLLAAAALDDPSILRFLVNEHGADVNFVYECGTEKLRKYQMAVLIAVKRNCYAMVDVIASLGGDVNLQDHKRRTPLHHAVRRANHRMVRLLLSHGAMGNICDADGQLPLDVATPYGHQEMVKLLMRSGGNLYRPGDGGSGSTPIHAAAREGHANLLQMFGELYRADGNFMTQCEDGISRTPLHIAASEGNPDSVKALLEFCSADPNLKDSDGNGAIHCVLANRCPAALGTPDEDDVVDTVRVLISHGVDYNRGNGVGDTALHLAARNGFAKAVQVLVEAGCDTLLLDSSGLRAVDLLAPDDEFSKNIIMAAMEERIRSRAAVVPAVRSPGAKASLRNPPGMRNHKSGSEIVNQEAPDTSENDPAVARPRPAVRKTKSVENLDQELDNGPSQKTSKAPDPATRGLRIRSNSVQGSEATDLNTSDVTQPSGKRFSVSKQKKAKKLVESEEPPEAELPSAAGRKTKILKINISMNETVSLDKTTDSEEYLLNGDAKGHAKGIPPKVPKKTITKKSNSETHKRQDDSQQPSLQAWLDEQARLIKVKETGDQGGPVAQSTPPAMRNNPLSKEQVETSTNDSDSDANLLAEQRAKQKPPPPPKPTKARNISVSSAVNVPTQKADLPSTGKVSTVTSEPNQNLTEVQNRILQRRDSQTSLTGIAQLGIGADSLCFEPASPVIDMIPSKANSRLNMSLDSARAKQLSKKNLPVPKARESHSGTAKQSNLSMKLTGVGTSEAETMSSDENNFTAAVSSVKRKQRPMSMIKDSEVLPPAAHRMQPPATEQHSSFKPVGLVFEKAAADVLPTKNPGKARPPRGTDKDFVDSSNETAGKSSVANISRNSEAVPKPSDVQKPSSQPKTAKQPNKTAVVQQSESEEEDSEEESEDSEEEEEDEDDEEEESEDEDEEEVEAQPSQKVLNTSAIAKSLRNQEIKVVTFYSRDNPGFSIIGGNAEGIFVHSLDPTSEAARNGLSNGDQILRANGKRVLGLTKEEASQVLRLPGGELTLHVRSIPDQYKAVMDNGGIGDGFFVQAQFNHDPAKKGELNIREGDIFSVTDTLLENSPGLWKAHKINAKKNEEQIGTIPGRQKADQIIVKYRLSQGKSDQRGGAFFRSFRRSKSAERHSKGQEDEEKNSSAVISDVVSYQRVIQRLSENRRPVVVLGLFCDIVISMLIRDSPELFETPQEEVENSNSRDDPVNVRLIQSSYYRGKHCLVILTPPSIEYLQQKTELNPIVIYISPVSKSVVKAVKAKLAPNYNKNAGYMYDEAAKFEKSYGHLFSTSIAYTTDDWWFFHLKEAIGRIQNQPIWRTITDEEAEASATAELNKICPGVAVLPQIQERKSRDKTPRFSRTTDDLPVQQQVQAQNGGVRGRPPLAGNRELHNRVEVQDLQKEMVARSILKQRNPGGSVSSDQVSIKGGVQKGMSVSFDEQESSDMPKYITGKIPKPRNPTSTMVSHYVKSCSKV